MPKYLCVYLDVYLCLCSSFICVCFHVHSYMYMCMSICVSVSICENFQWRLRISLLSEAKCITGKGETEIIGWQKGKEDRK